MRTGTDVRRVLVLGDLHLQADRLRDQAPVLDWVSDRINEQDVDVLVINGDVSGSACPHIASPAERNALLRFILTCQIVATREELYVIVVRGNHDVAADWDWLGAVPDVRWCDRPTSFDFDRGGLLHILPYPDKSWLASGTTSSTETSDQLTHGLGAIMHGFAAATPPGVPSLLVGHVGTSGAEVRIGQPLIGQDVEVPTNLLKQSGADAVLLNHIHMPQEHNGIIHVGSPWPTRFGENEDKSVCLWHVREKRLERLATPHPKLRTAELQWNGIGWDGEPVDADDRTRLRLRLVYDEGAEIDVDAAKAMFPDAATYRVERQPIPKRRERAPEVVQARGAVEQFVAFEVSEGRDVENRLGKRVSYLAGRAGYTATAAGDGTMRELRLKRVEMVDMGVRGRRVLDLDQMPDGIIGIDAPNGAGKSTLLEASCAGAAFRNFPSRKPGNLFDVAVSRTAVLDVTYEEGEHEWRLLHHIDGEARKTEAHIYRDGKPYSDGELESNGKNKVFKALVAGVWPTWDALAATRFQKQGGDGSWSKLKEGARRELLREMLGLAGLQSVADEAKNALRGTHLDLGALEEETGRCEERLAEWDRNRVRLEDLRLALTEGAKTIRPLEVKHDGLQSDIHKALAWERADWALKVRAEWDDLHDAIMSHRAKLVDAEVEQGDATIQASEALLALDEIRARDKQAAAAWSQYRERELAISDIKRRLGVARSHLATDARPDAQPIQDAADAAAREVNDVFEHRNAETVLQRRLDAAQLAVRTCERGAELAGRVPCGGDGDYAECELLQDALDGKAKLPEVQAECEQARAGMTGVTAQDVGDAQERLAQARECVRRAREEQSRWDAVEELLLLLAKAESALGDPPEMEAELADALASASKSHASAAERQQRARERMAGVRANISSAERRLAEIGDPPKVEDVPRWDGPASDTLQAAAREVSAELQQLRHYQSQREGEAKALEPLVEAGKGLAEDLAAKQSTAADLAAKAADFKRIQDAFGPRGIQAVLVHDAGPAVSEATNALICEAYGWQRFRVDLQTVAEKASGDGLKDAMDVVVYDAERGASGKMENLSPGEIDMVRAAFAMGLSEHHSSVLGIRWLTAWADEPGSALTTDNAHRWMRMQRVALERLGIRQLLLVTHDEAVKATCDRVLDISELDTNGLPGEDGGGDTFAGRTAADNEAPQGQLL
jgi:DNA repair exonuclease SbcCD ATPase subunit/DNA repair exonuclease SbcCD nuclease subunit